ncbi:capsular polysaccharide synthesis protein, partial [Klebsiella pneumoniae]
LRFNLLATYGGVWVDATIFCTKELSFITDADFFTLKSKNFDNVNSISKGLWTGYFLKCPPNYKPFILIRDCFNKYWEKNNILIDYFLVDYLMLL